MDDKMFGIVVGVIVTMAVGMFVWSYAMTGTGEDNSVAASAESQLLNDINLK